MLNSSRSVLPRMRSNRPRKRTGASMRPLRNFVLSLRTS